MTELRYPATVDGLGRLVFDAPELRQSELARLQGKRVVETIVRERLTRTIQQNRLQWATYGEAVAYGVELVEVETGMPVFKTREDVHGFAKLLLLRRPVKTNRGEINLLGTTTTLSTTEHATYIEMLCARLASLGVYVPPVSERVGR